jgi:hypothetical protein
VNKVLIISNFQTETICQDVIKFANDCQSDFQFYVFPQLQNENSPLLKKQLHFKEGIDYLNDVRNRFGYSTSDFVLAFYNGTLHAADYGLSNLFMAGSNYEEQPSCTGIISLQYLNWSVLEEKYNYELQKHSILHLIICGIIGAYTHLKAHSDTFGCLLDFNNNLASFNKKLQRGYYLCDNNEGNCQAKISNEKFGNSIVRLCNSFKTKISFMKDKILFLTSNPADTSRLRIEKEVRDIQEGLRRSNRKDNFDFQVRLATRPRDLSRAILDENPKILHFSGHGETEGIILEDDFGISKVVTTTAISGLFSLFEDTIKCVILNSCYSENQAKEISKHIPFVIGMSKAVPDTTAIAFATSFYDAIGAGRDIEFAFKFGVSNISIEGLKGDEIPVLLKKSP